MWNKKCTPFILWILMGAFLGLLVFPGWGESVIKSELFENQYFRTRLWLRFPAYSLSCLGMISYKLDGSVFKMAGLEMPFFCFGPVALEGLIKEVTNPLNYQATSLIYRQNMSIQLNSSFQSKEQLGLVIGPFGVWPAFFMTTHEQAGLDSPPVLESWGCFAPWTLSPCMKLDWLWMYAPKNDQEPTIQTKPQPISLPSSLTTWAFRSRLKKDFLGGTLSANLTMALTNGLTEKPGYFCTFQGSLEFPWLEVSGLWGAATPSYLTIRYETPNLWQKAQCSGMIQILKNYWLGGGYTRLVSQATKATNNEASNYFPTTEDYTCKARATFPLADKAPLRELFLAAEYEKEYAWDDQGILTEKNQVEAAARLELAPYQFSLNYRYKKEAARGAEQQWLGCCSYYTNASELALQLAQDILSVKTPLPPSLELSGALKVTDKPAARTQSGSIGRGQAPGWSRLYLKVKHQFKTGLVSQFLLTIGWEYHWK